LLGGPPGTAGEVWTGIASGQNAPDRVRAVRRTQPETTRRRQAGDVRLSGLHAYQREEPEGVLCREAPYDPSATGEEAAGTPAATSAASARSARAHGKVAAVGRARLLPLSCGTGEPRQLANLSVSVDAPVGNATAATQPTPSPQRGPDAQARCPLVARAARSASLARSAVRRPACELRAVCANERPYGSVRGVLGNRYPYRDNMQVGPTISMITQGRTTECPATKRVFLHENAPQSTIFGGKEQWSMARVWWLFRTGTLPMNSRGRCASGSPAIGHGQDGHERSATGILPVKESWPRGAMPQGAERAEQISAPQNAIVTHDILESTGAYGDKAKMLRKYMPLKLSVLAVARVAEKIAYEINERSLNVIENTGNRGHRSVLTL